MNIAARLKPYDPQPYAEWAYVLRHDDLEDGVNKLGMRVKDPVFDTPLCQGCDQPIRNNRCDNCCVVFILEKGAGWGAAVMRFLLHTLFPLGCVAFAVSCFVAPSIMAMPSARTVAASPSNQQAVSPLRASILIAGERK